MLTQLLLLQAALLDDLLPATTPALPHIQVLRLRGLGIADFPRALAVRMEQLTSLDLTLNRFQRIPAAISLITTLKELHYRCNPLLQLKASDIELLAALPHLTTLDISKSDGATEGGGKLTAASKRTLTALHKRLPHLRLLHFAD